MTIHIHIESNEKVTNLAIANAIIEMCEDNHIEILNPRVIAKAILIATESEETE